MYLNIFLLYIYRYQYLLGSRCVVCFGCEASSTICWAIFNLESPPPIALHLAWPLAFEIRCESVLEQIAHGKNRSGGGTHGLFHPWARWMGGRTATNCCLSVCLSVCRLLSVVCLSVCLSPPPRPTRDPPATRPRPTPTDGAIILIIIVDLFRDHLEVVRSSPLFSILW